VGFGALAFVSRGWELAVTVAVWTFGEMILFPGSSAYIAEIAPENRRGEYMGFYSMAFSVAFIFGPWAGTQVLESFGAAILWPGVFIFGMLSVFLFSRIDLPISLFMGIPAEKDDPVKIS
jgi:MFS family permease